MTPAVWSLFPADLTFNLSISRAEGPLYLLKGWILALLNVLVSIVYQIDLFFDFLITDCNGWVELFIDLRTPECASQNYEILIKVFFATSYPMPQSWFLQINNLIFQFLNYNNSSMILHGYHTWMFIWIEIAVGMGSHRYGLNIVWDLDLENSSELTAGDDYFLWSTSIIIN